MPADHLPQSPRWSAGPENSRDSGNDDSPGHSRMQRAEVRIGARRVQGEDILATRIEGARDTETAIRARNQVWNIVRIDPHDLATARQPQLRWVEAEIVDPDHQRVADHGRSGAVTSVGSSRGGSDGGGTCGGHAQ